MALKALESLDSFKEDAWSYTKTTTSKEGTKVERHDATQPEDKRWSLVMIEGRVPTAKELEAYRQDKAKQLKERKERRGKDDQDLDRSSIRLVSETTETATFHFRPQEEGFVGKDMVEKILGTLVVNKNGSWAERFELAGTGEIRPVPGVKVTEMLLTMTFRRDEASGEILPQSIASRIRGRAFLVKSLDQDQVSKYSGFERVR